VRGTKQHTLLVIHSLVLSACSKFQ